MNFAENLISKEQMSKIKGGCGSTCTAYCKDSDGTNLGSISVNECTGTIASCKRSYATTTQTSCSCQ